MRFTEKRRKRKEQRGVRRGSELTELLVLTIKLLNFSTRPGIVLLSQHLEARVDGRVVDETRDPRHTSHFIPPQVQRQPGHHIIADANTTRNNPQRREAAVLDGPPNGPYRRGQKTLRLPQRLFPLTRLLPPGRTFIIFLRFASCSSLAFFLAFFSALRCASAFSAWAFRCASAFKAATSCISACMAGSCECTA